MTEPHHPVRVVMDTVAPLSVAGAIVGYLPAIAAALGIVWYCVLLYDRFLGKKK